MDVLNFGTSWYDKSSTSTYQIWIVGTVKDTLKSVTYPLVQRDVEYWIDESGDLGQKNRKYSDMGAGQVAVARQHADGQDGVRRPDDEEACEHGHDGFRY